MYGYMGTAFAQWQIYSLLTAFNSKAAEKAVPLFEEVEGGESFPQTTSFFTDKHPVGNI